MNSKFKIGDKVSVQFFSGGTSPGKITQVLDNTYIVQTKQGPMYVIDNMLCKE